MKLLRFFMAVSLIGTLSQAFSAPLEIPEPNCENQIKDADAVFWQATNVCDYALLERTLTDNVEFYHDFVGVTTGSANFIALIKRSMCKDPNVKVRRQAVKGAVHIEVLRRFEDGKSLVYGALVHGEHSFTVSRNGGPEEASGGAANFFNTLLLTKDGWKVARMVSYKHTPGK